LSASQASLQPATATDCGRLTIMGVVPANAGTHTAEGLNRAEWQTPFA